MLVGFRACGITGRLVSPQLVVGLERCGLGAAAVRGVRRWPAPAGRNVSLGTRAAAPDGFVLIGQGPGEVAAEVCRFSCVQRYNLEVSHAFDNGLQVNTLETIALFKFQIHQESATQANTPLHPPNSPPPPANAPQPQSRSSSLAPPAP
jgi:hypothetical protein